MTLKVKLTPLNAEALHGAALPPQRRRRRRCVRTKECGVGEVSIIGLFVLFMEQKVRVVFQVCFFVMLKYYTWSQSLNDYYGMNSRHVWFP